MKKNIFSLALTLSLLCSCQNAIPGNNVPDSNQMNGSTSPAAGTNSSDTAGSASPLALLVSAETLKLANGEQRKLDAAVQLSDGSFSKEVTWLSADSALVVISPQGEVKRIGAGDTSVVAISLKNPQIRHEIQVLDAGASSGSAAIPLQTAIPVASNLTAAPEGTTQPTPQRPPADISTLENTTINGKVFDDGNTPLEDVKITIKSLTSGVDFSAETLTKGGSYAFNDVPAGVQLEITASKADYTARRRVEVAKSNKNGNPLANRYDFGADGSSATDPTAPSYALSDKPEVIRVSPLRNSANVSRTSSLSFTFNKPIDPLSFVESFAVRAYLDRKLSADDKSDGLTLTGSGSHERISGTGIFNADDFTLAWNGDNTEVTLSLRNELCFPSDKDSDKVPEYQLAFQALQGDKRDLRDKQGHTRDKQHFKFGEGPFEESVSFAVAPELTPPEVTGLTLESAERAGVNGDALRVSFSERMAIHLRSGQWIAGGMGDSSAGIAHAPASFAAEPLSVTPEAVAANYTVRVTRASASNNLLVYQGPWSSLKGSVIFDANNDSTYKTVLLTLPSATASRTVASDPGTALISVRHIYADGTSEELTASPSTNTYEAFQSALNSPAILASGSFSLTETDSPAGTAGTIDAKDKYTLTLSADARGPGNKQILISQILSKGAFGSDKMNAPSDGYLVFSSTGTDQRLNLFRSGDIVSVIANTTITDPAGNALNTSKNSASAAVP